MNVLVVLPTYNEAKNLPILIPRLIETTALRVLVVDDDSPDGTGQVAEDLKDKYNGCVDVLHRYGVPRGLGCAYVAGFNLALETDADLVIGMDADLSHSPSYIPVMLSAMASQGYDIVVGSRYIPGGGVDGAWGWQRKLLSRGAQLWARTLLHITTHDVTGAFRCYSRRALQTLDFDCMRQDGFSFLIEVLHQAERKSLRIGEVPIIFRDREYGTSKVSPRIIARALIHVASLHLAADK